MLLLVRGDPDAGGPLGPTPVRRRQVEHEACMGAMVAAAGVRTPGVVFAGPMGNGAGLLIQRSVPAPVGAPA